MGFLYKEILPPVRFKNTFTRLRQKKNWPTHSSTITANEANKFRRYLKKKKRGWLLSNSMTWGTSLWRVNNLILPWLMLFLRLGDFFFNHKKEMANDHVVSTNHARSRFFFRELYILNSKTKTKFMVKLSKF